MSVLVPVTCEGIQIEVEFFSDGDFEIHGYDIDEALTLVEMGYEPTECLLVAEQIAESPLEFLLRGWPGIAYNQGIEDVPGMMIEYVLDCFDHAAEVFSESAYDFPERVKAVTLAARAANADVDNVELEDNMWVQDDALWVWVDQLKRIREQIRGYSSFKVVNRLTEFTNYLRSFLKYVLNEDRLIEDLEHGRVGGLVQSLRELVANVRLMSRGMPERHPWTAAFQVQAAPEEEWQFRRLLRYLGG